jgi:hypothetical protein
MTPLRHLLGREHELGFVNRALRDFAQQQRAPAVGALHVTCSDECEREAVESFQHWFAESLLPELKFASKSPFRTANLGGRYEWGAVRFAEQHFATREAQSAFKLLVVKLNAHVSVLEEGGRTAYGLMDRYGRESAYCGKLQSLLDQQPDPAMDDMSQAFDSEGKHRLAMLRDPKQVDPRLRNLLAAVVSARLQARRAIVDIQDYEPATPTVYLVAPCVTLNRQRRDTELVVGFYLADGRGRQLEVRYQGLGDDPSRYDVARRHALLAIEDDQLAQPRVARDHRDEVIELWLRRRSLQQLRVPRLEQLTRHPALAKRHDAKLARDMLYSLLWVLADLSPVPASIVLFGKGVAGIHHLYRVHRLARGEDDAHGAREIIRRSLPNVESLSAEEAHRVFDGLTEQYELTPASAIEAGKGDSPVGERPK